MSIFISLPPPDNWKFKLFVNLIRGMMKLYFRIEVKGLENLPDCGPAILVANHQSYLDIPAIGIALGKKKLTYKAYWVMGKTTFQNPYLKFFFNVAPAIVVNGTVRKAEWALNHGFFVSIFPEGFYTWHRYKALRHGQDPSTVKRMIGNSAAILGLKTGYPIIPIGIHGTEKAMPPYSFFPKPGKLILNIGRPFNFQPPEPEETTEEMIAEKSNLIIRHIDALR